MLSSEHANLDPLSETQINFLRRFVAPVPTSSDTADTSAPVQSLVALQKIRLAYTETRKNAAKELESLETAIQQYFADEPDAAEIAVVAKRVHEGLYAFDDALVDQLDEALNCTDPNDRRACEHKAAKQIKQYLAAVETDPILTILDDNPIKPLKVQASMRKTLTALSGQLAR